MPDNAKTIRFESLMSEFLDGTLDDEGRREFAGLLKAEASFTDSLVQLEFFFDVFLASEDWDHVRASQRGVFVHRGVMKFRDILDGLANTIAAGEIATDLGDRDIRTHAGRRRVSLSMYAMGGVKICDGPGYKDPRRPQFWDPNAGNKVTGNAEQKRGYKWALSQPLYTQMMTILPPNREVCLDGSHQSAGICPPSSRHQGGCHVLMADGAVKFITDSIEAGNRDRAMVSSHADNDDPDSVPGKKSPFGLWGALGTRASKENIEKEL